MAKSKVAMKAKTKAKSKANLASKKTSKAIVKSKAKSAAKVKKGNAKSVKIKVAKKVSAQKPSAKKASAVKASVNKKSAAVKKTVSVKPVKKSLAKKLPVANNLKMTPLDDRLLVEVDATEKKTPGGLYIPETAQVTGNYQGRVLAVGRGHMNKKGKTKPMDVKVGDVILFSEYAGEKYSENDKDIRIIREADVLGVVSNEN